MKKKLALILILTLVTVFCAVAADDWYYNMEISEFSFSGLKNVSEAEINNALYIYRYKPFTDELFSEIQSKLYEIDGIDFFTADAERNDAGDLRITFEFYEIPMISKITYEGNSAVKTQQMVDALIEAMGDRFMEGDAVQLPDFSLFEVKKKLERIMVNPSTGQRMLVPPKLVLGFKPTPMWKDRIKNGGSE